MPHTPQILLNNTIIDITIPLTIPLLDVIRYHQGLTGTKIGCREGDCGACVVMVGEIVGEKIQYKTLTSCLTPIANVIGMHVVTIEGLNLDNQLNQVQQAIVDFGGTQCGACTPGFVVSIMNGTSDFLENKISHLSEAIDGNICRCTGYKSIEKAIDKLETELSQVSKNENLTDTLIQNHYLPSYFSNVADRVKNLKKQEPTEYKTDMRFISGGTDLYVQLPDAMPRENVFSVNKSNTTITETEESIIIGGSCTATQIMTSDIIRRFFPDINRHFKLIASTPIRNIATIGGNIINASPIADMVMYFLPMDPIVVLKDLLTNITREIRLSDLYVKYKTLDRSPNEIIGEIHFKKPQNTFKFNFEKVSKRLILDIASVNTGFFIEVDQSLTVVKLNISAGGVYEVPKLLKSTQSMIGKKITPTSIFELLDEVDQEILPISDIRGSKAYKRKLLRNLIISHFLECFSEQLVFEELIA